MGAYGNLAGARYFDLNPCLSKVKTRNAVTCLGDTMKKTAVGINNLPISLRTKMSIVSAMLTFRGSGDGLVADFLHKNKPKTRKVFFAIHETVNEHLREWEQICVHL